MTKLRCLVIDDEPFAVRLMEDEIRKIPFLELVASCSATAQAIPYLEKGIDLLFLDIQMPKQTGIQFLRELSEPPLVIITTAFEQHALEGFELNVVDYLLKPVLSDRLLTAAARALELFELRRLADRRPDHFFIRSNYKKIRLTTDEVLYLEGLKDYVKIFTATQPLAILTRHNLKGMESILPPNYFFRLHNSFIVNVSKITEFQKSQVFIGKTSIPIGSKFADSFAQYYKTFSAR